MKPYQLWLDAFAAPTYKTRRQMNELSDANGAGECEEQEGERGRGGGGGGEERKEKERREKKRVTAGINTIRRPRDEDVRGGEGHGARRRLGKGLGRGEEARRPATARNYELAESSDYDPR